MAAKILWTICFGLLLILIIVIGKNTITSKSKIGQFISGEKSEIPKLDVENLPKPPQKKADVKEPIIYSKASILIDEASFQQLYAENPEVKVPIASTTKIMTALVVLEDYPNKMKDVVTITQEMISVEGSDIQLRSGEKMSVENLLNGLLIASGNDAAYSLSSYLGGKEQFVKKMNEKAVFIGLKNTMYKDPAGLDDEGYSTARDLGILSSYALHNETFAKIVKTPEITIISADGMLKHELKNSNRMMRQEEQFYYPYAIGTKTGFTLAAGHSLVSAAQKDGHKIVAVVLNTNESTLTASAKESRKLLDWGFTNWTW